MSRKKSPITAQSTPPAKRKFGPSRLAGRMLMIGLPLILLGCCDFAARINAGLKAGEVGIMLRLGPAGMYILVALIILLAGALLMEYMERPRE